jgi:hypothetical protein
MGQKENQGGLKAMSAEDRPATKAFVDRKKNLHSFFKEKKTGLYDKDFADWCDSMGLSNRTARENYWDRAEIRGIIRIVFEKKQKFWEYCDSSAEGESFIESVIFDKAMKLGLTRKQARIAHQFSVDEKCTFEEAVDHIYGGKK